MTSKYRYLCVAISLIASFSSGSAPALCQAASKTENILPIPEAQYEIESIIASQDVAIVEQSAMSGSAAAAVKLARHFGTLGDTRKQIFWLQVAVENGDDEQQLWLARALWLDDSDQLSVMRSRYWYNRIIESGSPEMSAFARKELDSREKYRKDFPRSPHPS